MSMEKGTEAEARPEDGAQGDVDPDRRAALRAIAKYSGAAGAGRRAALSAHDAVAPPDCPDLATTGNPGCRH